MQTGYGIKVGNEIDLRTVSDTERAAKVNALVLHYGVNIGAVHTDAHIEHLWRDRLDYAREVPTVDIEVVAVEIRVAK